MKPKITALLPMKGNSERVPNKNLKSFNGVPLYRIVLDTLLRSSFIDNVIVNTDSLKIEEDINDNFSGKVLVINRPQSLCGDYVSMNEIIKHDINHFPSDIYLQTHSTNPLLELDTIDNALKKMTSFISDKQYDSIFSVTKIQKRFYKKDATPMNHNPKMLVTQHLEPIFEENSCFFIFTKKSFEDNAGRIGSKPFMFEINKIEATDIDDPEDFILAEILHRELRQNI